MSCVKLKEVCCCLKKVDSRTVLEQHHRYQFISFGDVGKIAEPKNGFILVGTHHEIDDCPELVQQLIIKSGWLGEAKGIVLKTFPTRSSLGRYLMEELSIPFFQPVEDLAIDTSWNYVYTHNDGELIFQAVEKVIT